MYLGEVGFDGFNIEWVYFPITLVWCRTLREGIVFKLELGITHFLQSAKAEVPTFSLGVEVGSIQRVAPKGAMIVELHHGIYVVLHPRGVRVPAVTQGSIAHCAITRSCIVLISLVPPIVPASVTLEGRVIGEAGCGC